MKSFIIFFVLFVRNRKSVFICGYNPSPMNDWLPIYDIERDTTLKDQIVFHRLELPFPRWCESFLAVIFTDGRIFDLTNPLVRIEAFIFIRTIDRVSAS